VDELSSLLGELVDLASDLAAAEPQENVRLGDLARAVAARTQRRFERLVTVDDDKAVDVVGRPRQLERAISNLVDNAVKYSQPETPIEIVVDGTTVTVNDSGSSIASTAPSTSARSQAPGSDSQSSNGSFKATEAAYSRRTATAAAQLSGSA
jgi:signal transduction histidine kinase